MDSPWSDYASSITSVVFASVGEAKVVLPEHSVKLFHNLNQVTSMNLSGADASHAMYLYNMFEGCSSLTSLDLSGWNTSSATDMGSMFSGCTNLRSVNLSGLSISGSVNYMFYGCSKLASLTLAGCNVSQLRSTISMFEGCSSLTSVDLAGWDTSQVTSMWRMFEGCSTLSSVGDLSGWDTSNVKDMAYVFKDCSSLTTLKLSGWDTSKVTGMTQMFNGCTNLETLDLSNWTLGSVVPSFAGCSKLATLTLSGWDTKSVTDMSSMFSGCSSLAALDLSGWNTSNVTKMGSMFSGCSKLASLNLSGWSTSNVTGMSSMFSGCSQLAALNLSSWNTSKVTNTSYMFNGCTSLASLDLSGWDVSKVTGMTGMFSGCANLETIDLSGWKIGSVVPAFSDCSKLAALDLYNWNWDDSNVTDISQMFCGCSSLTELDLSGWDTSKVTNAQQVFSGCSSLATLDLSGWDTSQVSVTVGMFSNCASIETLKVGDDYAIKDANMFPDSAAEDGKWWSVGDKAWYAKDAIVANRSRTADTYTNYEIVPIDDATVTFAPDITYAGVPLVPVPTVTIGTREFVYNKDFTCSYANNVNVGTATVTITGKGACEGSATATFQIAKAPLTVRARGGEVVYGSEPGELAADYEGLVGSDTAESLTGSFVLSCDRTQYSSVGGYTVTFSSKTLSSDNYDISYADGTITVVQRPVGLSWSDTSFTYDAGSHCPTATATDTVNDDVVTVVVGGAQTNAGTYTAEATSVSNPNYCLPEDRYVEFSINKAAIEPTVRIEGWTYGEQPSRPTVSGNSGEGEVTILYGAKGAPVTDYVSDPPTNAGDYVVRAVVAETANYKSGVATTYFSVSKATPSVTSTPMAKAGLRYTGEPQTLIKAGSAKGGTMLYSVDGGPWVEQVPEETDAGTYMVGYKIKGDNNHLDTETLGTVPATIGKAANTLSVLQSATEVLTGTETDLSKLVEGGIGEVSYSLSGEGLEGCSLTSSGAFTAGNVIGTCVVAVTAAGDKNHADASKEMQISVLGDVSGATIVLADGQDPLVYTGEEIEPGFVVKVGEEELVLDNDYTLGFSNNTNAGTDTATVTVTGMGNYRGTKSAKFTIAPATITSVEPAVASCDYDGTAKTPAVTVRAGSLTVPADGYDVRYESNTNAGTATVTVTGKGNFTSSKSASFQIVKTFPDVPKNAWYAGVVTRAASLGLLNGYANGNFGPDDKITRGQVAVVLWNMAKSPEAGGSARSFPDVKPTDYFYRAVRWASSKGVVSGYDNGSFGSNDFVTREQLAVMLANYSTKVAGRPASGTAASFGSMADKNKVSSWAVPAVGWCFKNKILSGSRGNILPQGNATRAEACKMVMGLYDLLA